MKMLKTASKFLLLSALFLFSVLVTDEVKNFYMYDIVGSAINPAMHNGRTIATTFNLSYKGNTFTVTNLHVCNAISKTAPYINVNGKSLKVLHRADNTDLCFLEPYTGFLGMTSSLSMALTSGAGQEVILVGYPRGMPLTIRKGNIISRGIEFFPWISSEIPVEFQMISAIGYGGNSGSPVVNRFGRVVGVLFAGSPQYHTESLIIPLYVLEKELNKFYKLQLNKKLNNVR